MTTVNGEARVPVPEPDFEDYELAIRALSGAKLRPGEDERLDTPELREARFRVENCMRSEIIAARAVLLALAPRAMEALGELLDSANEKVRSGAFRMWATAALPADPVQVAHTHTLDPTDRELVSQAASDFSRLTNELSERLTGYQTIDLAQSPHLLRGEAARPIVGSLQRAELQPVPRSVPKATPR